MMAVVATVLSIFYVLVIDLLQQPRKNQNTKLRQSTTSGSRVNVASRR